MKHLLKAALAAGEDVAPFTGAWIETPDQARAGA